MEDEIDLLINMAGWWNADGLLYVAWDISEDRDVGVTYSLCPSIWNVDFISPLIFT